MLSTLSTTASMQKPGTKKATELYGKIRDRNGQRQAVRGPENKDVTDGFQNQKARRASARPRVTESKLYRQQRRGSVGLEDSETGTKERGGKSGRVARLQTTPPVSRSLGTY